MAFELENLNLLYSGGASNADTAQSIGGVPSIIAVDTTAANNVFDVVPFDDNVAGFVDYRCIYLRNNNDVADTMTNGVLSLVDSANTDVFVEIGIVDLLDEQAELVGSTLNAPTGVTFGSSAVLPDIPGGSFVAVWLRRTVAPGVSASISYGFSLSVAADADTSALPATDYANRSGQGNRREIDIYVTTNLVVNSGTIFELVNGNQANNQIFWQTGDPALGKHVTFRFLEPKLIDEISYFQALTTTHGTFRVEGSNDGVNWDIVSADFVLGGFAEVAQIIPVDTLGNTYVIYRFFGLSGTMTSTGWVREVEFKISNVPNDANSPSYYNRNGAGSRIGTMIAGADSWLSGDNEIGYWIDGEFTNNTYFPDNVATAGNALEFDFLETCLINQILFYAQSNVSTKGTWRVEASNDKIIWDIVSSSFLLFDSPLTEIAVDTIGVNYRYYRLVGVSGTMTNDGFIYDIRFQKTEETETPTLPSYFNTGGVGDRSATITVTTDLTLGGGDVQNLVAGDTALRTTYFTNGETVSGKEIKFVFANAILVSEISFSHERINNHGVWRVEASNDGTNWTTVSADFTLGNERLNNYAIDTIGATYTQYRLFGVSGTTTSDPWLYQFFFKLAI